jgi:hypothetical protein
MAGYEFSLLQGASCVYGIGSGGFLHNISFTINNKTPWTSMPEIEPEEIHCPPAGNIQGYVIILFFHEQKIAHICGCISTGSVIGTPHIGTIADTL